MQIIRLRSALFGVILPFYGNCELFVSCVLHIWWRNFCLIYCFKTFSLCFLLLPLPGNVKLRSQIWYFECHSFVVVYLSILLSNGFCPKLLSKTNFSVDFVCIFLITKLEINNSSFFSTNWNDNFIINITNKKFNIDLKSSLDTMCGIRVVENTHKENWRVIFLFLANFVHNLIEFCCTSQKNGPHFCDDLIDPLSGLSDWTLFQKLLVI